MGLDGVFSKLADQLIAVLRGINRRAIGLSNTGLALPYRMLLVTIGLMALPGSVVTSLLWQGVFGWIGFDPAAPFIFGAGLALLVGGLFRVLVPAKG